MEDVLLRAGIEKTDIEDIREKHPESLAETEYLSQPVTEQTEYPDSEL